MDFSALRIHHLENGSRSNGPGIRSVLWLQGCSLGCPGCFNPLTHPRLGGITIPTAALVELLKPELSKIEGLTISGGEPLQQIRPLMKFLGRIRAETKNSVILFSGYSWEEIQKMPAANRLPELVDVLIAGRYQRDQRIAHSLQGSANKTFHYFSNRYRKEDFLSVPQAEVIIGPSGDIVLSGIEPLFWKQP